MGTATSKSSSVTDADDGAKKPASHANKVKPTMPASRSRSKSKSTTKKTVLLNHQEESQSDYYYKKTSNNCDNGDDKSRKLVVGRQKYDDEGIRLRSYVQNVADNAHNLPVTRRDDPDLGRVVSTLTAEEYSLKAQAFIRADVRVIGASSSSFGSKYGRRVWNLPTSEDFTLPEGLLQDSHDGISNSFLKVIYDFDTNDDYNDDDIPAISFSRSLFDDDDVSDKDNDDTTTATKYGSSDDDLIQEEEFRYNFSWLQLLRIMEKNHRHRGGAIQFTSSRKMDLGNTTFSLSSSSFDSRINHKRALLVGCTYLDTEMSKLTATHDDILSMREFLYNIHGFRDKDVIVLSEQAPYQPPTYKNILQKLQYLSRVSKSGDVVFFHYIGHAGRVFDIPLNSNVEGYDEILVPCDFNKNGFIKDTLLFQSLLAPMVDGVTITCIFDACHKDGFLLDLPYTWSNSTSHHKITEDKQTAATPDHHMVLNQNFSFLRFLKIIKNIISLSKAPTDMNRDIHKNSGGGLSDLLDINGDGDDDEHSYGESTEGSLVTVDGDNFTSTDKTSFFRNIFNACQNPPIEQSPVHGRSSILAACGITSNSHNNNDCDDTASDKD